ncbi:glucose dehydrogenase [FAD, quinone]-like isoform X2 [Chelonus insularis]|uniref:glucose dehydrogenase [FAD, quinone]-like isoform X2 n=1 Tax=Chelonus insularis TaxID=460826 RepID=UPI00158C7ED1|nr:glucose dehydrogenase [FAD, quinone]-like isoform X2 [Chelonus insularis]
MIFKYLIKSSAFFVYGIAVFLFIHFLNISYVADIWIDWFLNDLKSDETYDFIIVGAGSAGVTVAYNLINAGYKIALIEAGGAPPWFADIPVLAPLFQQSPYDWQFKTIPQAYACKGLTNNQSIWPMGKILGGSSRLNYMAYVQGHPSDYQGWFPDYTNYTDKLKNFISENPGWCSELCDAILGGIEELSQLKFSSQNDENEDILDFEKVKLTMINGQRWSTDKLLSNKNSNDIKVITHAYVEKILFESNIAKGVKFTKWKKQFNLFANEGVILSAGTIGSPKLLMLSGIGPKHDLQKLNINVIRDLPVGKNLMDHILTGIDLVILNSSLSVSLPQLLQPKSIIDYFLFHQGSWTSAGIEIVGTISKANKHFSIPPNIQFMIIPVGVSQDNGVVLRKAMGIKDELFQDYFAPLSHQTAITIAPVLLHPESLGEVRLKSSDPFDDPIIDPRYLSHNNDILTLIEEFYQPKNYTLLMLL